MPYGFNEDKSKYELDLNEIERGVEGVILNRLYPVGSIYMTTDNFFDPETSFPGTSWEKVQGRFLLGTSGDELSEATGGNSQITLNSSQCAVPEHTHPITTSTFGLKAPHSHKQNDYTLGAAYSGQTKAANGSLLTTYLCKKAYAQDGTFAIYNSVRYNASTKKKVPLYTDSASPAFTMSGGTAKNTAKNASSPVSIMPPYYKVHIWRRTA